MSRRSDYIDNYAEYAMQQMRLYGIPASITLAQGIIESADGRSRLALNGNNHFGIKATQSWIDSGGKYGLHTDDKPNEKFCYYDSVADSYEHHSRFLANNKRYSECFSLSPDDYRGWAKGLQKAGYATSGTYASAIISVVESNNLQKYDQMVIAEMAAQGLKPGDKQAASNPQLSTLGSGLCTSKNFSFPLKREEFLFVTSPYGNRTDPMNGSKTQFHKGIDIRCNNEALLATENNGRVVATNENVNTGGGKSVTVEYGRNDGSKYQVMYCHMSSIDVKVGDTVNAGQKVGVSGNTGTRTTGPHLHLEVKSVAADGTARNIDPASYLAEIAQLGNIKQVAMSNGKDLLEKYKVESPKSEVDHPETTLDSELSAQDSLTPEEWMKKLLSSEDSGVNLSHGDPIMDFIMTAFTSLMALAVAIDNRSEEEAMALATEAAVNKRIDLSQLVPGFKECALTAYEGDSPKLLLDNGNGKQTIELSNKDINRLNIVLQDKNLSVEEKQQRIGTLIGNIALSGQMSQQYQQGMQAGQQESLTIK